MRARAQRLDEALGAGALTLSPADLDALAAAMPPNEVAGGRYSDYMIAHLDSEKP